MKRLKKILALALAMAMVLGMMSISAFAADTTYSVSMDIADGDKHEYKVYQIFTGDLSDNTLSNVKYGNSGYGTSGDAVPTSVLEGITDANAFAKSISSSLTTTVGVLKDGTESITGLTPGYYLIVDDTEKELVDGDAYSAYIVKVVKNVTLTPKKDTTSVDKKITTDTLGKDDATTTVNGKVDNVSIGDTVNFEISGTVPSHATDYNYYYYILGDTLTDGLTFNSSSIVVKAGDTTLTANTDYKVYTGADADGKTFQVALIDAKAQAGKKITVTYSATLNEKAKIGELSNDNTVTIEYSNKPNYDYDGDKDENKPGKPDKTKETPLGETPESKTTTYTTGIEIQKVDENGKVLTGAEFKITGDNEEIVLVSTETFAQDNEKGTYYKLKGDKYTTEAPQMEDEMIAAPQGATDGYVVAEAGFEGETKEIDGVKYRVVNQGETPTHILKEKNSDLYADTENKYSKTITYTQKDTNTSGVEAKAEVGPDGVVRFVGLGKGTYTISETKTPAGYNTIPDQTVTIDFKAELDPTDASDVHWKKTSGDATYNKETGVFEIKIVNQKGSTLPETGGIGTTIFYVVGTILVIGAGVVLITRRRMSA